jgi:Txe/YoeB family toxin of Txe-Axe toxin-antitoxin module
VKEKLRWWLMLEFQQKKLAELIQLVFQDKEILKHYDEKQCILINDYEKINELVEKVCNQNYKIKGSFIDKFEEFK